LVTDAIHMSSCFPIMFKPFVFENHTYVDGGIGDNFPVVYSSVFPGKGVCICVASRAGLNTYRNVPYFAKYLYDLFKIHNNIIARDQDVVSDRECFFLKATTASNFFDFSISRCQLVALFYSGYDELEKTCTVMKNGSRRDI
jgi:predicted acylesterase/phospholipase RssA